MGNYSVLGFSIVPPFGQADIASQLQVFFFFGGGGGGGRYLFDLSKGAYKLEDFH